MEQNYYKSMSIVGYITIFLLLTDSVCCQKASLQPNYDNAEHKLVVFDDRVKKPLMLMCNITAPNDGQTHKLLWTRNDIDVSEDPQLKNRFEIIDKENKFIIKTPDELDAGLYTCKVPELSLESEINVVANVYFKILPLSIAVVEGEKLTIHCKAFGSNPIISWHIGDENYTESEGRIVLKEDEKDIKNAILIIEQTVLEDRKYYNCSVTGDAVTLGNVGYVPDSTHTYVRVKGKLAALWPFLGICAEVFVLCAIILIYEKKRNKAELDESDTDQSPEQEKLKNAKK